MLYPIGNICGSYGKSVHQRLTGLNNINGQAAYELERNAGGQFDPQAAGLLVEMIISKEK